ncbi:MAG: hypothetical protein LKE40_05290 [Spirochaetia bacterium]|jgi:hypothetical protein|nr:hypothetical protein [Spirochaetia bacterium]
MKKLIALLLAGAMMVTGIYAADNATGHLPDEAKLTLESKIPGFSYMGLSTNLFYKYSPTDFENENSSDLTVKLSLTDEEQDVAYLNVLTNYMNGATVTVSGTALQGGTHNTSSYINYTANFYYVPNSGSTANSLATGTIDTSSTSSTTLDVPTRTSSSDYARTRYLIKVQLAEEYSSVIPDIYTGTITFAYALN